MAYTKTVTATVAVAGVHTLTLSNVENLYVGDTAYISGVDNDYTGQHVLTAVDTTNNTVAFVQGNHTEAAATNLAGQLIIRPQWTTNQLVQEWLGIDVATANDTAYISTCVLAANEWAFRKRFESGYTDRAAFPPSADVQLGTTNYAAMQYRNRGAIDGFASFDSFSTGTPTMTLGQILALLACNRPQVG